MDLCSRYRGVQLEYRVLEATDRAILRYSFPLSGMFAGSLNEPGSRSEVWQAANPTEIVTDFFSELKSASSGFASFDYEEAGYEVSDLVKVGLASRSLRHSSR